MSSVVVVEPGDLDCAPAGGPGLRPRSRPGPARREEILTVGRPRLAEESLDAWEATHRARIDKAPHERGFTD
ncbi:hypothetical protein [Streptomyces sp. NPDC001536]|uniref:hypothetical protein n=1 Tax=Streptomyces sp. NPDC001536 TaxID=3364583 RepID=UPI0036C74506